MTWTLLKSLIIASLVATAAGVYLVRERSLPGAEVWPACLALLMLFVPYLALGSREVQTALSRYLSRARMGLVPVGAAFLVPYLVFGLGTGTFQMTDLLTLTVFLAVPGALITMGRWFSGLRLGVWDAAAMVAIWLPFDMGWIKDVWDWPAGMGAYVLNSIMGVGYAVTLFVCYRQMSHVGYQFRLKVRDLVVAFSGFSMFFVIALGVGLYTEFIHYNGSTDFLKLTAVSTGIFLFVALPEELLFRGLLQNLLTQKLGRPNLALLVTALIFGLTHLNNGAMGDWRYVLLATLAGVFYGRAYLQTSNLMAPIIIHTLVDAVWVTFFM